MRKPNRPPTSAELDAALARRRTRRRRSQRLWGLAGGTFFLSLAVMVMAFFGLIGGMIRGVF